MTENYLNILAETIRSNWDQPALTDFYLTEDGTAQDTSRGNHYTYGEMYAEICRVADLLTSFGLQKGDHIAICGANSAHWVIAYLAIAKMQGVSVTVMHSLLPEEIARLVDFSDAKALFTDEDIWTELAQLYRPSLGDLSAVLSLADWSILRGEKITNHKLQITNSDCGFPSSTPDDLAMICFTSGTSGKAKGVMASYKNISANVGYILQKLSNYKGERTTVILPMSHVYGLVYEVLRTLCLGADVYIFIKENGNFSLNKAFRVIKPYYVVIVPQMIDSILKTHPGKSIACICQEVKMFFGGNVHEFALGGAANSKQIDKILIENELPISKGYGMTECVPIISVIRQCDNNKIKSVGKVVPTLTARISPAGEILVKGENVMLGYYKDPEATAAKIDSDGWLHTGDKGHLDEDGYLYVEGRLEQDIIVLPNGENIRPDNIESLINALPEVKESIVLARKGNLVAIVVLKKSSPSLEERAGVRLSILRAINPSLPLFSQLYDVEITDTPLARTEKQTIKRYLYK